jgi:alpha/beta superfamily hydrolase
MTIDQFFLTCNGIKLYTTLLVPDINEKEEGYVIVHPFAEEKKSSQRILFEIANSIVERGYYVLMFDFSGCGDSEGELTTTTYDNWLSEIGFVYNFLKNNYFLKNIHFLGLRLGAFIANSFCISTANNKRIIMLEPVITPKEYFRKTLKNKLIKELFTQGNIQSNRNELIEGLTEKKSLDFDGHEIGTSFYNSILIYNDIFNSSTLENIFIINISFTGKVSKEYQKLITNGVVKDENLQTLKMEPFWDRIESSPEISSLINLIENIL